MKHAFYGLILLAMLVSPVALLRAETSQSEETKWVLFAQDPEKKWFDHYYDAGHLLRSEDDIIGAWVMVVPKSQTAKDLLLKERRMRAFLMEGYEDYQYTVTKMEIDCPNKMKAIFESKDYGKDGKILDQVHAVRLNWKEISPGSVDAVYHTVLCEKGKARRPQ